MTATGSLPGHHTSARDADPPSTSSTPARVDAVRVASLLERVEATDLDALAQRLDSVLHEVRTLAQARRLLSEASPEHVREGMRIAAQRGVSS